MQRSTDITLEAQRNVARLNSKIIRFPVVQNKLIKHKDGSIAVGMFNLINSIIDKDAQMEILIKDKSRKVKKQSNKLLRALANKALEMF